MEVMRYISLRDEPVSDEEMMRILRLLEEENRADASPHSARVKLLAKQAREKLDTALEPKKLEKTTSGYAKRTVDHNEIQLKQQLQVVGVSLPKDDGFKDRVRDFAAENAARIGGLTDDLLAEVQQTVIEGVAGGLSSAQIAEQIEERIGVSENRAVTIARDQVGSLYGQINAARQQSLGVKRFIWRTMHDDRVRDQHAARELESEKSPYSYDDPPDGELPGEPINCRCYAEPVLDDLLGVNA